MLVFTKRLCRNNSQIRLIASPKLFMTGLHLENRQKNPNLQKNMTTAIIRD